MDAIVDCIALDTPFVKKPPKKTRSSGNRRDIPIHELAGIDISLFDKEKEQSTKKPTKKISKFR